MNKYIEASKMTHTELEKIAEVILSKHSLRDVMKNTSLSYGTLWKLRKSSDARKQAYFTTLQALALAFPEGGNDHE